MDQIQVSRRVSLHKVSTCKRSDLQKVRRGGGWWLRMEGRIERMDEEGNTLNSQTKSKVAKCDLHAVNLEVAGKPRAAADSEKEQQTSAHNCTLPRNNFSVLERSPVHSPPTK